MTDTTINSGLTHYITWLKAHEKLVIISLGAWLVFHFYGDVLNAWVLHDKLQVAAQQQIAQAALQKTTADSQANLQLLQQLADLKVQYAALSTQMQITMQNRSQQTIDQKKKNDVSTSSEVASRTAEVLRTGPQAVQATDSGSLTFTLEAAHVNINALEDGFQAKLDVVDLNKQLAVCNVVNQKQDETITGVRKELTDEKESHTQDVKLERENTRLAKDEGKKQFRKGFKIGAILGFFGGLFAGHYI